MNSILVLAGLSLAVIITSFISGILGMADGMILMGVLLARMPLPAAMMLHGVTQMASNGWRACFMNLRTTETDVDLILDRLAEIAAAPWIRRGAA